MKSKGFTLIELLVVIAIIAILAAILFPVFAKVREKARQTTCLSNEKQIGLAILQYTEDFDESFPMACDTNWHNGWAMQVQPYIKSYNAFLCPDDSKEGIPSTSSISWVPVSATISYSANGLIFPGGTNVCRGPICMGQSWLTNYSQKEANMTQPSASIMVAETHDDLDVAAGGDGTTVYFGPGTLLDGVTWWDAPGGVTFGEIPNGTLSQTAKFPTGANGAVSATHTGLANFLFIDGHAKSMFPYLTNPNPTTQPQNNMWDAMRP
jgi:prepilin-type N-terminal cleavage/methylation domain-containing protein/prepilin-type processing-associated H-X9-DG protein